MQIFLLQEADGSAVATFQLSRVPSTPTYDDAKWAEPAAPQSTVLYLANLAVLQEGRGLGRAALAAAAEVATQQGCCWLRLDAIRENAALRPFYEACGYRCVNELPPALPLVNPLAGGLKSCPGAPGYPPYTVNAAAPPPPEGPTWEVHCMQYELRLAGQGAEERA